MCRKLVEKLLLRQGACFYINLLEAFPSETPHYFFVLNLHPKSDQILTFTNATTGKELVLKRSKRRTGSEEFVIEVSPEDYPNFLPETSYFDMSDIKAVGREEFLKNYPAEIMENSQKSITDIPPKLLSQMIDKVIACDVVSEEIKGLLK